MKPKFKCITRLNKILLIFGLAIIILPSSCKKPGSGGHFDDVLSNKIIIEWSTIAFEAAGGADEAHTLLASRNEAMMHIAIHDALNAIMPVYEQYAYHQHSGLADPFAAAASAAHTVLKTAWGDTTGFLDMKLAASLSTIPDGAAKTKGIAVGKAAGNAILEMRSADGAYQNPVADLPASTAPGVFNIVPPYTFVFAPFWKTMQTFALQSYDQFRCLPPPALNSDIYTSAFNEVKQVGDINSTLRTPDQSAYAKWWYELADIGWNRIARTEATDLNPGLYKTARMFALLDIAIADAYTAGWDAKFYYNFWRPYTAIHAADTDGNDGTVADMNWEPAEITPPVPDYPSTHSALGNAAATVLTHFLGNHRSFSVTSTTASPSGAVRSFSNFIQAADENADSRVMAGIHFRFSCEAGQLLGNQVGKWVLENCLRPIY